MEERKKIVEGLHRKSIPSKRTICEVHREIYRLVLELEDKEQVKRLEGLLEEAYYMAKRMAARLVELHPDPMPGFWKDNPNFWKPLKEDQKHARNRDR